MVEKVVGKRRNAGNQDFHLFPQCYQKLLRSASLIVGIVCWIVNPLPDNKILDLSKQKCLQMTILLQLKWCNFSLNE